MHAGTILQNHAVLQVLQFNVVNNSGVHVFRTDILYMVLYMCVFVLLRNSNNNQHIENVCMYLNIIDKRICVQFIYLR